MKIHAIVHLLFALLIAGCLTRVVIDGGSNQVNNDGADDGGADARAIYGYSLGGSAPTGRAAPALVRTAYASYSRNTMLSPDIHPPSALPKRSAVDAKTLMTLMYVALERGRVSTDRRASLTDLDFIFHPDLQTDGDHMLSRIKHVWLGAQTAPLLALAILACSTAIQVGCGLRTDDAISEDHPRVSRERATAGYGDDGYGDDGYGGGGYGDDGYGDDGYGDDGYGGGGYGGGESSGAR